MSVAAADLRTRFPEFGGETDDRIGAFITAAGLEVNTTQWGVFADEGVLHLAAHKLYIACQLAQGLDIEPGIVKSEQVGDVRQSYAVSEPGAKNANEMLMTTTYGREYIRLRGMGFPIRLQ